MYRLYGAPGRASMAPEAVLECMELKYEYIHLEPEDARTDEAYRRLNPQAQVPTLVDGDTVVWESAAVCIYLCDRHPEKPLAPHPDSRDRGPFYQWMFFLSNTLQPAYMVYFYSDRYSSDTRGAGRLSRDAETRIAASWRHIDHALQAGPYFLGEQFSVCDIYLYMLSTWHRESIISFRELSHVDRNIGLVAAQPGVKCMMLRNEGH